jgi:hypothetical protein
MHLDCDTCVARRTDVCGDCLVTHLIERPPGAIIFDVEQERAIRALQDGGLAPATRFRAS